MSLINIYIGADGKAADEFVSSAVSDAPAPPVSDRQAMESADELQTFPPLPPALQQESGIADWGDPGSAPEPPPETFGEPGSGDYVAEPVPPELGVETAASVRDDDLPTPPTAETEEYGVEDTAWDEGDLAPMPPEELDERNEVRREIPLPPED